MIVIENRKKILNKSNKKQQKMGITIITVSFVFMLFTLPTASIQGKVYGYLISFDLGKLIILLCNAFTFTYQSSSFILYYITNSVFRKEVKNFFAIRIKNNFNTDQSSKYLY